MFIKEIKIRNFRSIVKAEIPLNNLSLFVGFNDVGKSNILKALNLFFNDETDYEKKFNFEVDYCKYSPARVNKAQEIIIEVIFNAPANYKDSKDIVWKKVWRRAGLYKDDERKFVDGTPFPPKSKLYSWLENNRFSYIPAIRDTVFFQELLATLHDSLAETIEIELRSAGDEFIDKIKNNTKGMIQEIDRRLKITSQIKLPTNLQSLFRTLDFSTTEGHFQVSLANRGDGIKTRHIPVILKFISDQLNINRRKGSPNVNMIWGYEEPENNLEMIATFNLAKEFFDYSHEIQILITTHSPGFYTLKEDYPQAINLFKVVKESNKEAEVKKLDGYRALNEDMGVMPIIAPYVKERIAEINQLKINITNYESQLSKYNKNVIFVEGDDEVRVFTKIISDLGRADTILVSKDGLGCSGVKSQVMAWAWVSGVINFKAFGVFDNDKSGKEEYDKLLMEEQYKHATQNKKTKACSYSVPQHLINIKSKIPNFPIELEEMYSFPCWEMAKNNCFLEERPMNELTSFFKLDSSKQTIDEKIDSFRFSEDELRLIRYKIPDRHKDKVSKYLAGDEPHLPEMYEPVKLFLESKIIPFFN
ncbi:MAG: ATP-binding protein [Arcicella sp.]|jgi:predicted ATPase|nr:ATP-binding protein [Arcicella sp.]